jgi:trimeric autotransporter adhesin
MKNRNLLLKLAFLAFLILNWGVGWGQTDLIISEYVEGSSNNKYLELFNGTGSSINLSNGNYTIDIYFNGSTSPTSIPLTGTLNSGSTFVIAHSSATIWGGTPNISTGSLSFNGDDAIALRKNGILIDLIGNIGCDPGTEWGTGNLSTADNTIRRYSFSCEGVSSDPTNTGCPFPTLSIDWEGFSQDDVSGLGSHTSGCSTPTPTVTFTSPTSAIAEGNSGATTHQVSVSMNTAPSSDVTVQVTDAGSGTATGSDYSFTTTNLTFTTSESYPATKTVDVTINGDTDIETNETINLSLAVTAGTANTGTTSHTVTITNDDVPPTVGFALASSTVNEAAGTHTVDVTLTNYGSSPVTVNVSAANGTAETGDYTLNTSSLTFSANETQQVSITINQDADYDNETFTLSLAVVGGSTASLGTSSHTVTINDDDAPPTVGFASASSTISETAGTHTVDVTLTNYGSSPVTVNVSAINGTAEAGDYTINTSSLTFTANETQQVSITINQDADFENETFTLSLAVAGGSTANLGTSSHSATITDDEVATAGMLIITEIMYNPSGSEPDAEWFEIYNKTANTIDLKGWTIQSGTATNVVSTSVIVAAGGYAVLGANASGCGTENYIYGTSVVLSNSSDDISIKFGATTVDFVAYGTTGAWPADMNGFSILLSSETTQTSTSNDTGSNWCRSVSVCGSDRGTPGSANDNCVTWDGGAGTTNWGDAANWSSDMVPTSADFVNLNAGSNTTINVNVPATANDFTLGTNIVLNLNSSTLTVNGNFTQAGGTLNQGSGTLDMKGTTFTKTGGGFNSDSGTTSFSGGAQSITSGVAFNHLSLSGGAKVFTTGQTFSATDLTVASSATLGLSSTSSTTFSISGNLTYSATTAGTNLGSLTLNLTGASGNISTNGTPASLVTPNITVASGAVKTLSTNFGISAGRTFSIASTGRLNAGANTLNGAGAFSMGNGSILATQQASAGFGGSVAVSGTITTAAGSGSTVASIIEYNANGDQIITASHPGNCLIWTAGSGTKTLGASKTIDGSSGSSSVANGALQVAAGTTFSNGGSVLTFTTFGYAHVIINGTYSTSGSGGLTFSLGPTLSAIQVPDGADLGNLTINFGSASNLYVNAPSSGSTINLTLQNLNFGGAGGGILKLSNSGTTHLTVNGNITYNLTSTGNTGGGIDGTSGKTTNVILKGNITSNSTNITQPWLGASGTNTLTLSGNSLQSFSSGGNCTFLPTGTTWKVDNANGISFATRTYTIAGIFEIMNGTVLTSGGATIAMSGTTSRLKYSGSTSQTIGSEFPATITGVLEVNNANGLTLGSPKTVIGGLILTNGILTTSGSSLLTLGSTATLTGGSATSYINGPMAKTLASTSTFTFPIGNSSKYRPLGVIPTSTAASTFRAEYLETPPTTSGTTFTGGLQEINSAEYFDLQRTSGTASARVVLSWGSNSAINGPLGVLVVAHLNGTVWENLGNASTTGSTAGGTITSSVASSNFSPFALGSTLAGVLPVELVKFSAINQGTYNLIEWTTATEINVKHFVIERSQDGRIWSTLEIVPAAGTTAEIRKYEVKDPVPFCLTYYRLRSIDFDGREEVFKSITALKKCGQFTFGNVFPNPVGEMLTLEFEAGTEGQVEAAITDISGKIRWQGTIEARAGFNRANLNLADFRAGVYFLVFENGVERTIHRIVKL